MRNNPALHLPLPSPTNNRKSLKLKDFYLPPQESLRSGGTWPAQGPLRHSRSFNKVIHRPRSGCANLFGFKHLRATPVKRLRISR